MTSVSLRCWVNKYPLEGNKCLICWERSIPAHPAGSFPWPVMASQVANIWIVLLAPEMQYCSTVVRPPALHQRRRTDGSEQLLIARPAQLCPAFQKGHCRTRGATERPSARFPVLPCRALRHWKCGSLPEQPIPSSWRAGPGTALCWHSRTAAASSAGPGWGSQHCAPVQSVTVPLGTFLQVVTMLGEYLIHWNANSSVGTARKENRLLSLALRCVVCVAGDRVLSVVSPWHEVRQSCASAEAWLAKLPPC